MSGSRKDGKTERQEVRKIGSGLCCLSTYPIYVFQFYAEYFESHLKSINVIYAFYLPMQSMCFNSTQNVIRGFLKI